MEAIDLRLRADTAVLEQHLFEAAERMCRLGDIRWYFAHLHGSVAAQIGRNLRMFRGPNAVMWLDRELGRVVLRQLPGSAHDDWKHGIATHPLPQTRADWRLGDVELASIDEVNRLHVELYLGNVHHLAGGVDPQDFVTVSMFVQRASELAERVLRKWVDAHAMHMLGSLLTAMTGVVVRRWRDAVYTRACHLPIRGAEAGFERNIVR